MSVDDRVLEIVVSLERFEGTYRRQEVDDALALRQEITPPLIAILKEVLADPVRYAQDPSYFGHLYAVELLAHFREPRAHDVIVDLFSLPPEFPHDLFGDVVTEDLPAILLATCGGSVERIEELLLNQAADVYCRSSAARALASAVALNVVPRAQVIALFGSLFIGAGAEPDSDFWAFLTSAACDLYPEELMDVIRGAFDRDLVSEWIIDYALVEETLRRDPKQVLQRARDDFERYMPEDFHDRMSRWPCFQEEEQVETRPAPVKTPAKRSKARKKRPKPRPRSKRRKRR
jgi:hypothetical protein